LLSGIDHREVSEKRECAALKLPSASRHDRSLLISAPLIEPQKRGWIPAMSKQLNYDDVEQYLRSFSQAAPTHDFGGLLHLVLAGIEHLRENAAAEDIRENAHFITDAQAIFLQRLLAGRAESIEWYKDDITHSRQTGQL
jgi:hypothetical protein